MNSAEVSARTNNGALASLAGLVAACASTFSCATAAPAPSSRAAENARGRETIVSYRPVGDAPSCARYTLQRDAAGLAFMERDPLGVETEFPVHWVDPDGDHFAVRDPRADEPGAPASAREGPAREVWIPADRSGPAYLFVYRFGLYELRDAGGVKRPVPLMPIEARAKLEPLRGTSP